MHLSVSILCVLLQLHFWIKCRWASAANAMVYIDPTGFYLPERSEKPTDHPLVIDAANYVVRELQQLSDSGVYSSLSLHSIHTAASEMARFHKALHLQLSLASPYFASQEPIETYQVLVLDSKRDGPGPSENTSFAIDTFPIMSESAIQDYLSRKVARCQEQREALFRHWSTTLVD